MKTVFILIMIVLLICAMLYTSLWLMLIGGIVQIVDAVKATPTDSLGIAIGIVRVLFFEIPLTMFGIVIIIFAKALD